MMIQMEQHLDRLGKYIAVPNIDQLFVRIAGFIRHVENHVENVKLLVLQCPRQQHR